ncbi:MAG: dihydrofolate reductase [Saprospiraceae bacterium]|nr:dihydrofolate reductase [Saprospiraceae bacterium]
MQKYFWLVFCLLVACETAENPIDSNENAAEGSLDWEIDRFADIKVLRYIIPDFDRLNLNQKKLVYYLTRAGLAGRDIMYDMNYRHNLEIRKALEAIVTNYQGEKNSPEWESFLTYAKQVWFANGIHHHYSMDKFKPAFEEEYFRMLLNGSSAILSDEAIKVIFDPELDAKKVNLNEERGLLKGSAVNFYDPSISAEEAQTFYAGMSDKEDITPISYGLNSKLVRSTDGSLREEVYKVDGLYGPAIREMIKWLEKAISVVENEAQAKALKLLIEYFKSGDLETWDEYNIAWLQATEGDIDYILGFVEVYNDPIGYKGSYESIIQINDFEASARMKVLADNAQWFEDQSTIDAAHKKTKVVGVSYKVVNVAGESGDASPATPIGVNLPNANWIRSNYGSKSVSLGNIIDAHNQASGPGLVNEFAHDEEEIERIAKYGELADKLSTALHEVIGHASGQILPGVGTPKETLKNYASTIEEARADIIGLYFIMDQKMIDLNLLPTLDAAKAEYDNFISNGLMRQLRRIELGKDVEEAHMRNRQLISAWAYAEGEKDNIIEKVEKSGKTYYNINDYEKLREIFGRQLNELQRITSEGDYDAAKELIEKYAVKVDAGIHAEVLARIEILNLAPYSGFVNPKLLPQYDSAGEITDIKIDYPGDFVQQMLEYGKDYSFL